MDDAVLPEEWPQIIRLSLQSSNSLIGTLADTGGVPESEHTRKIIAAILWHRKFLLTYYAWIVLAVAVTGGVHFYKRTAPKPKRRDKNDPRLRNHGVAATSLSSSSSSTLTARGTSTPPQKEDGFDSGETTPLLSQSWPTSRRRPAVLDRLKSFLMFQPRPIPALTSPSNTLPNNATTLVVLLFLAVNLFYLFYHIPLSLPWIFILADRAGLLFVVNLPVLYFLAAKNNQPLKYLTGCSYEGLNILHRRLGEWMTCFAVIHMCGMLAVWYTLLRPLGFSLLRFLTTKLVFLGICAVISYYVIYITSVGWFRQLYYETFLVMHIIFQLVALVFLFFHYHTARPYVSAALAVWAVDRLLWRMTLSSRRFIATLDVAPDGHTVLVHCEIPLDHQRRPVLGIQTNLRHGWLPSQHVFLSVPSMGFKYRFQAHPFTIASPAPPENIAAMRSWPLQLTIRAIDGFSLALLHYARHHQHCEVVLDGPYGSTSALAAAQSADRVCFVAGGSGIAVTYPLCWAIRVRKGSSADAGLLLSTRTAYKNGLKTTPTAVADSAPWLSDSKYAHFWVRQEKLHGQWICTVPRASAVKSRYDGENGNEAMIRSAAQQECCDDAVALVTQAFDTRSYGGEGGRPDMQSEIYSWVTSVSPSSSADVPGISSSSSSSTALDEGPPGSSPTSSSSLLRPPSLQSPNTNFRNIPYTPSTQKNTDIDTTQGRNREKICIIVSGPDGLVRDVRNVAADLVRQGGWDIDVYAEKFGW
ncbi:uncharacterized protein Z520_00094 [Fonsecaea multimorphosa CBS 102226]|uniref:FAD-binding FR-type domain-containing protein n=1 Tax=Fonsecaea multimorphosa CBS 102226 TaxID=1442371 RepID=A0A0D2KBL1_9EURO|nr:uncharacterized protein Z520_00094 [Fonsecaea multimorphosa CBS 102226]KIY03403.1 hypothetical protein Z520_00094 [Fonsecaea multimorphosa CBS 102226]OAL33052.1 hypothetical protein AYO22_00137 [Fonsecaea multimorphosa]